PIAGVLARDGRIYTAGTDGRVITWDQSGKQPETLNEPSDRRGPRYGSGGAQAVFAPDASSLAMSETYGAVIVRGLASGEELFTFQGSNQSSPPAFSRDGKLLAVASYDFSKKKSSIRVIRADSGEE